MFHHDGHHLVRRALWAFVLALLVALVFVTLASPALAAETVAPDSSLGFDFFDFSSASNVALMVGFFIPIITGVITKKVAHPGVKAVSTTVLSALAASVAVIVGPDNTWAWRDFGNAFLSVFIPAIVVYYGFWKPTTIAGKIQDKTADFGLLVKAKETVPVVVPQEQVQPTSVNGEAEAVVTEEGLVATEESAFVAEDPDPDVFRLSARESTLTTERSAFMPASDQVDPDADDYYRGESMEAVEYPHDTGPSDDEDGMHPPRA